MKKQRVDSADNKQQDNIGYENTEIRNDEDDKENKRMEPAETGNNEGPVENKDDTEGLRSESGGKSLGKESGNKERG